MSSRTPGVRLRALPLARQRTPPAMLLGVPTRRSRSLQATAGRMGQAATPTPKALTARESAPTHEVVGTPCERPIKWGTARPARSGGDLLLAVGSAGLPPRKTSLRTAARLLRAGRS